MMSLLCDYRPDYDQKLPLNGYSVVLAGRLSNTAANLQKKIKRLGGTVPSNIDATTDVVISTRG
jgi:NAD-dependent DNA ligase